MARAQYPSDTADKFLLRLPDGMRPALAARARRNMRSANAEIVMILASALGDESDTAAGLSPGKANPAAVTHDTALPGGPAVHG